MTEKQNKPALDRNPTEEDIRGSKEKYSSPTIVQGIFQSCPAKFSLDSNFMAISDV